VRAASAARSKRALTEMGLSSLLCAHDHPGFARDLFGDKACGGKQLDFRLARRDVQLIYPHLSMANLSVS
jgi:hypothetical protein